MSDLTSPAIQALAYAFLHQRIGLPFMPMPTSPFMDSINKNQPEENHKDLRGREAIDKVRELVKKAQSCFFCTGASTGSSGSHDSPSDGARPMNVRQVDDDGNLWFLSASDSHKSLEIAQDPLVKLYFQGGPHSDFLQLNGRASVSRDQAKIRELWEPILKTWFTEGIEDPRITVIKVTPHDGYYWDTKHGNMIAGVKMLIGAMIGQTLDDSIEGTVRV